MLLNVRCPHCREKITILFCEDGDPKRDPVVVVGLAADVKCNECGEEIRDEKLG